MKPALVVTVLLVYARQDNFIPFEKFKIFTLCTLDLYLECTEVVERLENVVTERTQNVRSKWTNPPTILFSTGGQSPVTVMLAVWTWETVVMTIKTSVEVRS